MLPICCSLIRQTLRSTLFPYTSLFRSAEDTTSGRAANTASTSSSVEARPSENRRLPRASALVTPMASKTCDGSNAPRSEEHTSELQSLAYLVCRLLLEKKKKSSY